MVVRASFIYCSIHFVLVNALFLNTQEGPVILSFYGHRSHWKHQPQSLLGQLTFSIDKIATCGIVMSSLSLFMCWFNYNIYYVFVV